MAAARVRAPTGFDRTDHPWVLGIFVVVTTIVAVVWRLKYGDRFRSHDEYSYLLQARMLVDGVVSWPTPPFSRFFEAPHVLMEPVYASKYLPGQALMIAPFLALGVPWLGPCLATGATAALLYFFIREERLVRPAAIVAVAVFSLAPAGLAWSASFMSHSGAILGTTIGLVGLQRLRSTGSTLASICVAGAVVYVVLCRPMTGVTLAAVMGLVFVSLLLDRRLSVLPVLVAVLIGLAGLAAAMGWSEMITGSFSTTPWGLWARQYSPFDGPGIGAFSDPAPLREVPEHFKPLLEKYRESRVDYTWSALPSEFFYRWVGALKVNLAAMTLVVLVCFGLLAALKVPGLALAGTVGALYFLSQIGFHSSLFQYSSDFSPAMALLVGGGAHVLIVLARSSLGSSILSALAIMIGLFFGDLDWSITARVMWGGVFVAVLCVSSLPSLRRRWIVHAFFGLVVVSVVGDVVRTLERQHGGVKQPLAIAFAEAKEAVAAQRGLLFVRHGVKAEMLSLDLTLSAPRLEDNEVVVAVDLGEENQRLIDYLNRPAWIFDADTQELKRWSRRAPDMAHEDERSEALK